MTLESTKPISISVITSEENKRFYFYFQFENESDVEVYYYNENEKKSVLIPKTNYKLHIFNGTNEEGGYINIFNYPLIVGHKVIIIRKTEINQLTPYRTTSGFRADLVENDFDKINAIAQELSDKIDKVPAYDYGLNIEKIFIEKPIAGKGLKYDEEEKRIINTQYDPDETAESLNELKEDYECFKNEVDDRFEEVNKKIENCATKEEVKNIENKLDKKADISSLNEYVKNEDVQSYDDSITIHRIGQKIKIQARGGSADLDDINRKIETVNKSVNTLNQTVNVISDDVQNLKVDVIQPIERELTSLEARVETIEDTLDSLEKTVEKDVVINSSLWTDNEAVVSVEGVTPSKKIDWGLPVPTTRENADAIGNSKVIITNIGDGTVTFSCSKAPSEDLTISIKVRG